jgi:hypothetical protein
MKPITFCIPTANNEKDYVHLLLKSIKENTQIENLRYFTQFSLQTLTVKIDSVFDKIFDVNIKEKKLSMFKKC